LTFEFTSFLKLAAVTSKRYVAGGMPGKLYLPSAPVVTVRVKLVSGFNNVTVAPGTAAPFWSATVPLTPVVPDCAAATIDNETAKKHTDARVRSLLPTTLMFIAPPRFIVKYLKDLVYE
jgi:hypothetical protein